MAARNGHRALHTTSLPVSYVYLLRRRCAACALREQQFMAVTRSCAVRVYCSTRHCLSVCMSISVSVSVWYQCICISALLCQLCPSVPGPPA